MSTHLLNKHVRSIFMSIYCHKLNYTITQYASPGGLRSAWNTNIFIVNHFQNDWINLAINDFYTYSIIFILVPNLNNFLTSILLKICCIRNFTGKQDWCVCYKSTLILHRTCILNDTKTNYPISNCHQKNIEAE